MKIKPDKLFTYFQDTAKYHFIHGATTPNDFIGQDLVSHLNPLHPHLISIVGDVELTYLNSISNKEQVSFIEQISDKNAQYLIFQNDHSIPSYCLQQNKLHIVRSEYSEQALIQRLNQEINNLFATRESLHGSFVVVQGQGILITGNSGAGKSNLLLNLVKQNHLWVADDISLFYLNHNNQVIGHPTEKLNQFIHIKGLGPINMDKSYGQACRIPSHPLAAVIHLGDNSDTEHTDLSALSQVDKLTLHKNDFPLWRLPKSHPQLTLMVETCVKNLILNDWGYNATTGLDCALNNAISEDTYGSYE